MLTLLSLLLQSAFAADVVRLSKDFVNVYAILGPDSVVLVDAHNPDHADWIAQQLQDHGRSLDEVSLAVITHAHADHAGSAAALQQRGVPLALGAADAHMAAAGLHDDLAGTDWRGDLIKRTVDPRYPAFTPDVLVDDVLDLTPYGVDAQVRRVAGHTSGSLVVILDDQRVISGDLVRGRFIRQRRPVLHFFHQDQDVAHQAVATLLDEGSVALLPAHGDTLSAARLRRWLKREEGA